MYFKTFPKTFYEFKLTGSTHELLDIFARVKFRFTNVFSSRPHSMFSVSQGDTPDVIAHKFYGSSEWWWLVLLYNDIVNPFSDIPRLGFDRLKNNARFAGASTQGSMRIPKGPMGKPITRKNSVAYINRQGGDDRRDFQEGDIILRTTQVSNTAKTQNVLGQRGNQKILTQITGPEIDLNESTRVTKKIISWDPTKKEAVLDSKGVGLFQEGDGVAVIEKDSQGIYRPVIHGKIEKFFVDPIDSISHFIDNRTGARVDPFYDPIEDKVQNLYARSYHGETGGNAGTLKLKGTVLDTFMEITSLDATPNSNNYRAVTEQEVIEEATLLGGSAYSTGGRLKLLDPTYKIEALNLVKELMQGQRYASYESTQLYNNTTSRNIRGSGGTSTSRIY